MKNFKLSLIILLATIIASCSNHPDKKTIVVKNNLNINRTSETINLGTSKFGTLVQDYGIENLVLKDTKTGEIVICQWVDNNQDEIMDELLFQTDIAANDECQFTLEGHKNGTIKNA